LNSASEIRPPDVEDESSAATGAQQITCTLEPLSRGKPSQPGWPTYQRKPELGLVDLQGCSSCRVFRRSSEMLPQCQKTIAPAMRIIHPNHLEITGQTAKYLVPHLPPGAPVVRH